MSKDVIPIREFSAFDIGNHYLKLQMDKVEDKDIGRYLRRWVEAFAVVGEVDNFDEDCLRVVSHNGIDNENADMIASIYGELDDVEDDFD